VFAGAEGDARSKRAFLGFFHPSWLPTSMSHFSQPATQAFEPVASADQNVRALFHTTWPAVFICGEIVAVLGRIPPHMMHGLQEHLGCV
jgi:hypothetical protein